MSQSIKSDKISESTVARIAGNLLSGFPFDDYSNDDAMRLAREAVALARIIVAEVQRTAQPSPEPGQE